MLYLFAIILPPIAVLMCGKPFAAILNLILTCLGVIPGMIHAIFVVNSYEANKRNEALIAAVAAQSNPDALKAFQKSRQNASYLSTAIAIGIVFLIYTACTRTMDKVAEARKRAEETSKVKPK